MYATETRHAYGQRGRQMSSEDYRETPATIRFAVNLLWAAFLSSLAKSAWLYFQMKNAIPSLPVVGNSRAIFTDTHLTIGTLVGFLFSGLICLFIFDKISDGKNWARIVVAIEFAFSFMDLIFVIAPLIRNPIQPSILSLFSVGFSAYALQLLFTEPGKSWFQRSTTPPMDAPWSRP